jgi:polysaccharide biosynthesis transport protein
MDLLQFIHLLSARRRLFGAVLGSIVGAATLLYLIQSKTYIAEVSVIVDSKTPDPITGLILPEQLAAANLATQVEVITSRNVAAKVVDRLQLTSLPEVREQFMAANGGRGSLRDYLAEQLLRRLEVKPSRLSNLIIIRFGGSDPDSAATIANAFADAYIQTSLELTADPARRQSEWFDNELASLRSNIDSERKRLSEYEQKENMLGQNQDHLDVENAKLGELTTQLVAAQASMYDARTRIKQMNEAMRSGRIEELPDLLGNPVLQSMKVDLVRAQATLAQTTQRYGNNHPEFVGAAAQVHSLQSKLAAELQTARGSIIQTAEIADQRTAQLQQAVDAQKARILELGRRNDTLDVLRSEVTAAQHAYDAASQRASEVRLQGHLDQSSIAILNPAIAPLHAARPNLKVFLAVSLVLGTIAGTAAVLLSELRHRRVRRAADLLEQGILVLAEIPALEPRAGRGSGGPGRFLPWKSPAWKLGSWKSAAVKPPALPASFNP